MAVIRPLCAQDDFNEVGDVYVQSWKVCYQGLLPQAFLDKLTRDRWSGMLRADPSASLGVFEDGRIVGTAMVSYAREPGREGFGEAGQPVPSAGGHGTRIWPQPDGSGFAEAPGGWVRRRVSVGAGRKPAGTGFLPAYGLLRFGTVSKGAVRR